MPRMRFSILGLAVLIIIGIFSAAPLLAEGSWQQNQSMEEARSHLQAVVLNDEIYVAGGAGLLGPEDTFALYDPVADFWIPQEALPGGREQFAMAAVMGKVFISGGFVARETKDQFGNKVSAGTIEVSNDFWGFEPEFGEWVRAPNMPGLRSGHVMVGVADKLYVLGGTGTRADEIFVFNIAENKWSVHKSKIAQPRVNAAAVATGSKIYIIGGVTLQGAASKRVDVFNAKSGTWSQAQSLPKPRIGLTAGVIDGHIHAAGGATLLPRQTQSSHFVYDPKANEWSQALPLPTPRSAGASATVNGRWYVIGGGVGAGFFAAFTATDVVESFVP